MNIIGIVCEYNPFHNGHLYQLSQSRRALGEDSLIVAVMSGDYVQRGDAAQFSKFARAEAACLMGADIVIELPLPWCLSSAETFAAGAVRLLVEAGCTHISFGSECGELAALCEAAELADRDDIKSDILSMMHTDAELSYAKARQQIIGRKSPEAAELITEPNNILAVEYIKAINRYCPSLTPYTVRRIGSGHDCIGQSRIRSAHELRSKLQTGESIDEYVPGNAMKVFRRETENGRIKQADRLELVLLSRLRMFDAGYYDTLPDAAGGAGRRLYKAVCSNDSVSEMIAAAATKRYTASRMRRMLYCAALGVSADDMYGAPPYMRILALSGSGREHMRSLRGKTDIPIIIKPTAVKAIGGHIYNIFALGASAHEMYLLQYSNKNGSVHGEDWRTAPFIV